MKPAERFWELYERRFGEYKPPVPDLGCDIMEIDIAYDGSTETIRLEGTRGATFPKTGERGIEIVLNELRQEYNDKIKITTRKTTHGNKWAGGDA